MEEYDPHLLPSRTPLIACIDALKIITLNVYSRRLHERAFSIAYTKPLKIVPFAVIQYGYCVLRNDFYEI